MNITWTAQTVRALRLDADGYYPILQNVEPDPETGGVPIVALVQHEKDGALIAAAPDLLAALEALLAFHERGKIEHRAHAQARAAIAKAKGGAA